MIGWTDIETDGLKERGGHILEIALVITDDQLNEVAHESVVVAPTGENLDEVVARMDPKVRDMHTKSGLIDEVRARGVRRHEAEIIMVQFAETHFAGVPGVPIDKCVMCGKREKDHALSGCAYAFSKVHEPAIKHTPLAGSTVAYFDRRWLREHMATFEGLFSHRSIDASTFTELSQRWAPSIYENRPKNPDGPKHRALDDARESINYLRYFRACGFVGGWASAGFAPTMEELRTHAATFPTGCCDSCLARVRA